MLTDRETQAHYLKSLLWYSPSAFTNMNLHNNPKSHITIPLLLKEVENGQWNVTRLSWDWCKISDRVGISVQTSALWSFYVVTEEYFHKALQHAVLQDQTALNQSLTVFENKGLKVKRLRAPHWKRRSNKRSVLSTCTLFHSSHSYNTFS